MEKATVKGFYGASLNLMAVLAMIFLTAIICVGSSQIKAGPARTANNLAENSEATPEQSGEWQTVKMRVTAYCPCRKCCGKYSDGITACGHKIRPGDALVAADKKYPFGTEILIPGYNDAEPVKVLDRGGVIRGNRLDVFFHRHEEALNWGVRHLDVKVRRGPPRK